MSLITLGIVSEKLNLNKESNNIKFIIAADKNSKVQPLMQLISLFQNEEIIILKL